jgi:hypothetical protein
MLNNGNTSNCGFADEIVSYIYDEIGATDRTNFERHLADCAVCTDEFAAISNARFSVFEWRREEFAHLSTPKIVIPFGEKQYSIVENGSVGLMAGLRGLLSISSWPVAVAAVLLVCLGFGFLAMTYIGRGDQETAANINVPPVLPLDNPNKVTIGDPDVAKTSVGNRTGQGVRPVKAVEYRRARPNRQTTSNNVKAPVLNSYDDNDDKSLRLADLFDEIGGGS